MKFSRALCSLILTTSAATLLCGNALARDSNAPPQRVVSYADLNLNNAAGVNTLYSRLTRAAKAVCQPMSSAPYLQRAKSRECIQVAIRDAVETINNVNLTAHYNARTESDTAAQKLAARR